MKILSLTFLALTITFSEMTFGWATETLGNEPLNKLNYTAWAETNILPVLNNTNRIYSTWCNGNEYFYYKGNIAALNSFLEKCATMKNVQIILEIKDGSGIATTFVELKKIPYTWNVNLKTGIASAAEKKHKVVTITIYADDKNIQRKKIKIPKNIKSFTSQPLTCEEITKKRFKDYIAGKQLPKSDLVGMDSFPKFCWKDIPVLLELASSTNQIPDNGCIPMMSISSYLPPQTVTTEGIIALYFIEGLYAKQHAILHKKLHGSKTFYRTPLCPICWDNENSTTVFEAVKNCQNIIAAQKIAVQAYSNWWFMVEFMNPEDTALLDPLDDTGIEWFGSRRL